MPYQIDLLALLMLPVVAFIVGVLVLSAVDLLNKYLSPQIYQDGH